LNHGLDFTSGPLLFDVMKNDFEKATADFIRQYRLLPPRQPLILAVSGGPDSVAMMHCLWCLKKTGFFKNPLICAHVNHGIRPDQGKADEQFTIAQANALGIRTIVTSIDAPAWAEKRNLSLETAARKLRIGALIDIAAANETTHIATGHHADDNAETLIQRIARGTGYRGLAGIWPDKTFQQDFHFVRPLLCHRRSTIEQYLNISNLPSRFDKTNLDTCYRRNFIRHKLLPALQNDASVDLVNLLNHLSASARRLGIRIRDHANDVAPTVLQYLQEAVCINLDRFNRQPLPIRIELVRMSLDRLAGPSGDFTSRHFNAIGNLASSKTAGKQIDLPRGLKARRTYDDLVITAADRIVIPPLPEDEIKLNIPGTTEFGDYRSEAEILDRDQIDLPEFFGAKSPHVELFDLDTLTGPLIARRRRIADRFCPLGLGAEKKLGKFFTDQKIPHHLRKEALVISDTRKIIWLWPVRPAEVTKITTRTKKILRLRITTHPVTVGK